MTVHYDYTNLPVFQVNDVVCCHHLSDDNPLRHNPPRLVVLRRLRVVRFENDNRDRVHVTLSDSLPGSFEWGPEVRMYLDEYERLLQGEMVPVAYGPPHAPWRSARARIAPPWAAKLPEASS